MEKSVKIIPQIYGYAVCLVAVITFLISATTLVTAVIDLGDPLHSGWNPPGSPSLASYELYKMDMMKSYQNMPAATKDSFQLDEKEMRAMFMAAKNEKMASARHQANRSLFISAFIIGICIVLFLTHWRWMQRLSRWVPPSS